MRHGGESPAPRDRTAAHSATGPPPRCASPAEAARRSATGSSQPPSSFTQGSARWDPVTSGSTRNRLRVSRRAPYEDDEHAQLLVRAEAMVRPGLDEDRVAHLHRDRLALDVEHAASLQHNVDLVVSVGLLPVRLRCDKDADAELESRRLVHDLVAAADGYETILCLRDAECVHRGRDYYLTTIVSRRTLSSPTVFIFMPPIG